MGYGSPTPPKRKRTSPADQMTARAKSQVMDASGTGDPMMDATISGEINRKTMMRSTMSPVSTGTQNMQNAVSSTYARIKKALGFK